MWVRLFGGLRPIVEFMTMNFAMQAIDQMRQFGGQDALHVRRSDGLPHRVPRTELGPAARVAAQHSQDYSSWYAHIPGVKVIAPYFAADAKGLLKAAIRDPNPVIFLENEIAYGRSFPVPKVDDYIVPIGKARVIRQGTHVTLVAYSICIGLILEAAEKLAAEGIDAELIDMRTLRPLDTATVIESVKTTNRIVTVEQGWRAICSIGSEIASQVVEQAFDHLDAHRQPRSRARTCRCLTPPISKSSRYRMSKTSSRQRKPFAIGSRAMAAKKKMIRKTGGCHCKAVRFEVQVPDEIELIACNCSLCAMTGYQHLVVPKSRFKLLKGKTKLTTYIRSSTETAKHMFCSVCGIKSFYVPRSHFPTATASISVASTTRNSTPC